MSSHPVSDAVILACHITGIYDVNRNTTLPNNDYTLVSDWAESIAGLGLRGILFHNKFTEATRAAHQNQHIEFIKIDYDPRFNPNVYRYFVYRNFLQLAGNRINSLFLTDVSDVVVVTDPFVQPLFTSNPNALFCGDEPTTLNNDWMNAHSTHLRDQVAGYAGYEKKFASDTLLNCGIVGGHFPVMYAFIEQLCAIHQRYNSDNKTAYTGDMGAFNYLTRTRFNDQLVHGAPVNTVFKAYQTNRTDCWFRHK